MQILIIYFSVFRVAKALEGKLSETLFEWITDV